MYTKRYGMRAGLLLVFAVGMATAGTQVYCFSPLSCGLKIVDENSDEVDIPVLTSYPLASSVLDSRCLAGPLACAYAYREQLPDAFAAITNMLGFGETMQCGLNEPGMNGVATEAMIPDYWPPDEIISQTLMGMIGGSQALYLSLQACRLVGTAKLYPACKEHDICREVRFKAGSQCDDDLLNNWYAECDRVFLGSAPCHFACRQTVSLSHKIMLTAMREYKVKRQIVNINFLILD